MLTPLLYKLCAIHYRCSKDKLCNNLLNRSSSELVPDYVRLGKTGGLPRLAWRLVLILKRVIASFWFIQFYRRHCSCTRQSVDKN